LIDGGASKMTMARKQMIIELKSLEEPKMKDFKLEEWYTWSIYTDS
jgi:hypothetical protein